ncbi:MAG: ParB/RepB/Spo0J family partition protein [Planctomycetes bacterium]|nr:ParB/RepB/Spo0J family partition protein [Planctomycetota bacterium]
MTLASIPLATIRESATNPRKSFDPAQLAELTASVRQFGVLQPILVRPVADLPGGLTGYELIAGARRLRAAAAAGLDTIPAIVRDLDDRATLEVQVIENLQRQDLGILEEARGFDLLHREHGYDVAELAAKVGKSTSYVYGRMQLVRLPQEAQQLIDAGRLTAAHALLLARIPSPEVAAAAAQELAGDSNGPLPIHEARHVVQSYYMLRLDAAPFDTTDGTLVPAAGPCSSCPKRTGNQKGLFEDIEGADLCTDSGCFGAKRAAGFERAREDAERAGIEVLPKAKTQAIDSVRLEEVCYDDPKRRTYRQLLGGRKGIAGVEGRVLGQTHDGAAEWRFPRKKLKAALKAAGHDFRKPAKPAASKADVAARSEREILRAVNDEMHAATVRAILGDEMLDVLQLLPHWIDLAGSNLFGHERDELAKRWGAAATAAGIDWKCRQRSVPQLCAILTDLLLDDPQTFAVPAELAALVGVDRGKVEREVRQQADLDAAGAKLNPKKAGPKPPKPTSKRPKAKKGKEAAAGGERDA